MRRGSKRLAAAGATALLAVVGLQTTAQAAERPVVGGQSTITIDPGFTTTLQQAGIEAQAIEPARNEIDPDGGDTTVLPVNEGIIDDATFQGSIVHTGGVSFTDVGSEREIAVSNFIAVTASGVLTAQVDNGPRIELYNSGQPSGPPVVEGDQFTVTGMVLTLTEDGAAALNTALGTTAFSAGTPYGSVTSTVVLGQTPDD